MGSWENLRDVLQGILGPSGKVYYCPPESVKLEYPCVIFRPDKYEKRNADNSAYKVSKRYSITLIYREEDADDLVSDFLKLQYCSHNRHFESDNLNHEVFTIYF